MAHNFNNRPQGSPPNISHQGFEDLMGSLKSPGLTGPVAPFQQDLAQWPMPMHWQHGGVQGNFPFNLPQQGSPPSQMDWSQNTQNGYVSLDQGEEEDDDLFTVDDTDILNRNDQQESISNGKAFSHNQQSFPPGQIPSLSSSSPLSLPPPQFSEGQTLGSAPASKSPMVSNAATTARAAELRAKLLASRGSKSVQGSPAVKTKELSNANKPQLQGILKKQINDNSVTDPRPDAVLAKKDTTAEASTDQAPETPVPIATSLDSLMAEARDAADAKKSGPPSNKAKHKEVANGEKQTNIAATTKPDTTAVINEPFPGMNESVNNHSSPSELSEPGEIRSDGGTPTPPENEVPPNQPQASKTSEPSKPANDTQDKQEKLARQNEVKKAYQPLKKTNPKKSEPKAIQAKPQLPAKPAQASQQARKASFERRQSAYESAPIREEPRRNYERDRARGYDHWEGGRDHEWDRARDYDRWEDDRDFRRSSISQAYATPSDFQRDVEARRQKLADDNARRAAEYKSNLDSQGAPTREENLVNTNLSQEPQKQDHGANKPPKEPLTNGARKVSVISNGPDKIDTHVQDRENGGRDGDTTMVSPQAPHSSYDDDVNDWLELSDFHDEEYRERRLGLFRKKKALDIQRAELEREEEMELQQRIQRPRASSVLPSGTTGSTVRQPSTVNVRMPPPPLPLPFREANKDTGMRIKDRALSAGLPASQIPSPSLKRQHAEDDLEPSRTNSIDKRARLDMSGPSSDERPLTSPSSAKGERPPVRGGGGEAPPLEARMSRYDSWVPRPRSRSPDFRRRSLSPRSRRDYSPPPPQRGGGAGSYVNREPYSNSAPGRPEERTCYNCGERGHLNSNCPLPRHDGKEERRSYQQWVNPAYRGKNPAPKAKPEAKPGANNRSRLASNADAIGGGGGETGGQSR